MNPEWLSKARRYLQNGFLWMIILSGIAGIGLITFWWYNGIPVPQYFIDAGPALLVLVTMVNIGLAGLGYLESRKERQIARESLDLHQKDIKLKEKPGVIDTIAFSIDPTKERLQEDQSKLSEKTDGYQEYPKLENIDLVDKEMLQDVPDRYPDLDLDIPAYLSIRRAYDGKWSHLNKQIDDMIPEKLEDDTANELLLATGSSLDEIAGRGDTFWQRLDAYSDDLAVIALTGDTPQSTKGWIADNLEDIREALFYLRDSELLHDHFDELEKLREDLEDENERISNNLNSAKESLKEEYEIRESEITRRKEDVL